MESRLFRAPDSITLQAFELADLGGLREFARPIWEKAYKSIISPDQIAYMLEKSYTGEMLRREILEGHVHYSWIMENGIRAGFLACESAPETSSAFLHKFYILPNYWGHGIARIAMEQLLQNLASGPAQSLHLRVNRDNLRAIHFYKACGFRVDGEDCLPIGNGFVMDDFLMSRSLH